MSPSFNTPDSNDERVIKALQKPDNELTGRCVVSAKTDVRTGFHPLWARPCWLETRLQLRHPLTCPGGRTMGPHVTHIPLCSTAAMTLTFINKPDVLFVCWSESLYRAGRLLRGCTVVALPVQTVEHDLWGRRAGEIRQSSLKDGLLGGWGGGGHVWTPRVESRWWLEGNMLVVHLLLEIFDWCYVLYCWWMSAGL